MNKQSTEIVHARDFLGDRENGLVLCVEGNKEKPREIGILVKNSPGLKRFNTIVLLHALRGNPEVPHYSYTSRKIDTSSMIPTTHAYGGGVFTDPKEIAWAKGILNQYWTANLNLPAPREKTLGKKVIRYVSSLWKKAS